MKSNQRIENPEVERDAEGIIRSVRLVFGPHHFVEVLHKDGRIVFSLGSTHHGISADASEVDGELEQLINELMEAHPDRSF